MLDWRSGRRRVPGVASSALAPTSSDPRSRCSRLTAPCSTPHPYPSASSISVDAHPPTVYDLTSGIGALLLGNAEASEGEDGNGVYIP
ncbi:unnamed protein product [Peniophora sp. CBMAI 1063]|nr:unnamed protein product [Peniophora sp. CBMAI 1063]